MPAHAGEFYGMWQTRTEIDRAIGSEIPILKSNMPPTEQERHVRNAEAQRRWYAANRAKKLAAVRAYAASHRAEVAAWSLAHDRTPERKAYNAKRRRSTKHLARKALNNAVCAGTIKRGSCEDCGAERTQGHHEDYAKPLEVCWLCSACHGRRHRKFA